MPLHAYFSPAQIAAVRAALCRIIPPDEFPGALENGVEEYLARQFARDLAPQLEAYRAGLTALDAESQTRRAMPFAALDAAKQDEILSDIERGQTQTDWPCDARRFFEMLLNHAAEGYYADPGNGGNRAKASWQMIGFLDR